MTTRHEGGRAAIDVRGAFILVWAIALMTPTSRAEFSVGDEVPAFSLKSADGEPIELTRGDGNVHVLHGEQRASPKAVIIHLLQPDCLQCRAQLEALTPIAERYRQRGVVTLGIAHRGAAEAARDLAQDLRLPFPIAMGVDSEIADRFAAGDTLGILDAAGVVRFAQVGYGDGDAELWQQAVDELIAGKPVTKSGVDRDRLAVGDVFPAVHLPSLRTGKPMTLAGEAGRLVFLDGDGKAKRPKAAVGFFSRY
jgi:peroxiredoxin